MNQYLGTFSRLHGSCWEVASTGCSGSNIVGRVLFGRTSGLIALLAAGLLAGCATPPPASDPEALAEFRANNDPLEPTNRGLYAVNNGLDTAIVRPAAHAYRAVLPERVRNGVHN